MLTQEVEIAGIKVGLGFRPYVIAEIGSNFDQNLDQARRLIDAAADAKVQAVKFQLFQADLLYPSGGEMHSIFKAIELKKDWVPLLASHAEERGVHFLASAFDLDSVAALEDVGVLAHKIASSEIVNLPFVHRLASTGKPLFISTGMCDMVDIEEAVNICREAGNTKIILMQCGAVYPLPPEQAHVRVLPGWIERFCCPVGFSDHTLGRAAALVAVGVGARVFEKHCTLNRRGKGPDHFYAMEPKELKEYGELLQEAYQALGSPDKEMLPKERELGRREGVYAARDLAPGEVIRAEDVCIRRPALGIRARYLSSVVGAQVDRGIQKDQPLFWGGITYKGR